MENQPAPKSRKVWWVVGGIALAVVIGVAANSNSSTQTPAPSVQTANVSQQVTTPTPPAPTQPDTLSNDNYYVNSDGNAVHSPAYSNSGVPAGATAQCRDGSYSFSQHRSGTCSYHGGVEIWL